MKVYKQRTADKLSITEKSLSEGYPPYQADVNNNDKLEMVVPASVAGKSELCFRFFVVEKFNAGDGL